LKLGTWNLELGTFEHLKAIYVLGHRLNLLAKAFKNNGFLIHKKIQFFL
jgi:hypothetical protein